MKAASPPDRASKEILLFVSRRLTELATELAELASGIGHLPPRVTAPLATGPLVAPDEGTLKERIVACLRQRPDSCRMAELRVALPRANVSAMSAALRGLMVERRVSRIGRGRYRWLERG